MLATSLRQKVIKDLEKHGLRRSTKKVRPDGSDYFTEGYTFSKYAGFYFVFFTLGTGNHTVQRIMYQNQKTRDIYSLLSKMPYYDGRIEYWQPQNELKIMLQHNV